MALRVPVGLGKYTGLGGRLVECANAEVVPGCKLGADSSRGLRGWRAESRMRLWYIVQIDVDVKL